MYLDVEQRKTLTTVLAKMFPSVEKLAGFLLDELNRVLDDMATGNLVERRRAVIVDAESEGWMEDLLVKLHARPADPDVKVQLASIGTLEEIREERFHDACYVAHYPLVNRRTLRQHLRDLTTPEGRRVLLVKGSRFSGKSHSINHIQHVAATLGVPLAEIVLRRFPAGEEIGPAEFGRAIASALRLQLPTDLDAKPSRWSLNFLDWLAGELDPRRRLWIVFDDFEPEKLKVALSPAADEFVTMLAERVATSWPSTRLFLINYGGELTSTVKPRLARDEVPPISDQDLVEFFLLFYRDHMPVTDDQTVAADAVTRAGRVRARTSGDPSRQLEEMRDALIEQCEELQR